MNNTHNGRYLVIDKDKFILFKGTYIECETYMLKTYDTYPNYIDIFLVNDDYKEVKLQW